MLSRGVLGDSGVQDNSIVGEMLKTLAEAQDIQVCEIGEFHLGFVAAQVLSNNILRTPVKRRHTTHDKHAPRSGLQAQRRFERFCYVNRHPHPSKPRVELGAPRLFLAASAKNNRDTRKESFVRFDHELNGRWSGRNDQIWLASLILANVQVAQLVLGGLIGEKGRFERFGVELDIVGGVLIQGSVKLLLDESDGRRRASYFAKDKDAPSLLELRGQGRGPQQRAHGNDDEELGHSLDCCHARLSCAATL